MKQIKYTLAFAALMLLVFPDVLLGRGGGRGGGGGGGRGGGGFSGGGGGARMGGPSPGAGRSPAMSGGVRPSTGGPRPGGGVAQGGARPGGGIAQGGARPGGGISQGGARPGVGIAQQPGAGGVRPGQGGTGGARPGGGISQGGARPGGGVAQGGRPNAGQLNNFLNIPSTGAVGGTGGNRPGGAAGDFLQSGGANRPSQLPAGGIAGGANRPGQLPAGGIVAGARPATGVGIRTGAGVGLGTAAGIGAANVSARQNLANNRPGRVENRQELQGNRQQRRDEVRNQVHENHPRLDFWQDHPNWAAWRVNAPYRWATAAVVGGWLGYGSDGGGGGGGEAAPCDYGESLYYQDDQVYANGQPVATADEYAAQAATLAESAPEIAPDKGEWLPLGVFALTQDGAATGTEPSLFMQLMISKEGIIAGNLKNTLSGQSQTLEGMVDKKTQRCAWGITGKERPIAESGISNLTKDTAPILIHFADGKTQQWLMVRLEEPKADANPTPK